MRETLFLVLVIYVSLLSLVSIIVTAADKIRAVNGERRIPENTLLLFAAAGGSLAMYLTMQIIRHKTRHPKFMWGIPIIFLFQTIAVVYAFTR